MNRASDNDASEYTTHMRRFLAATLISATLAFPGFAQHGGSHGGFASHSSFAPHSGGGIGSMHGGFSSHGSFGGGFSAPRSFVSRPQYNGSHFARPVSPLAHFPARPTAAPMNSRVAPLMRLPYTSRNRGGNRYDYRGHRPPYRREHEWRRPSFYANSTYLVGGLPLYPFLDSDWDDDFNSPYSNNNVAPYNGPYDDQGNYGPVDNTQPETDYAPYAPAAPQAAPGRDPYRPDPVEPESAPSLPERPAVTLIFKDGRTPMQIHNYALTRTTLYVLDEHKHDIPLDQLDIAATEKTNQEAGNEFTLPAMP